MVGNNLQKLEETLPGAARAQHAFTSFTGEKYVAIGTSQGLFLYYEGAFYDITPLMMLLLEQLLLILFQVKIM